MGVSMHFVMSSAPALHDELQCIHNLTKPPGFLTGDEQLGTNALSSHDSRRSARYTSRYTLTLSTTYSQ